ncbi:Acg family FMN-binding oxidoreductase [Brevundimonas balnearis]|uniref:Acg family FMN-binding oxidoreductase n=1 Tax=Brevundimonas balnearis TaxID=1572858 RepID=A0ABV6R0E3_9CAUL
MVARRDFIRIMGGGVLAAPLLAQAACAPSAGLPDPVAAWNQPGAGQDDDRLFALAHGILAPNPHNRQPWLIELQGADQAVLHVDRERLLPVTDPFDRQIVIGCGAFVELTCLAATLRGRSVTVEPFPDGGGVPRLDDRPVARFTFGKGGATDPLAARILTRRSNKAAYDPARPLDTAAARRMLAEGAAPGFRSGVVADGRLSALRDLVSGAYVTEIVTPAAFEESIELMRIGREEIARHRDGIDIGGPMVEAMAAVGLMSRDQIRKPGTMAHEQGKSMYRGLADSSPAFVWLISEGNDRATQLNAGRAWARMNLAADAGGVAVHPVSQGLQEYAEVAEFKRRVDALVGVRPGERLQMLARAGYGKVVPPAPRRGLEEHLVS